MVKTKTTKKEKLNGTVRLVQQSLMLIFILACLGVVLAIWFDYPIGLIITGVALSAIAGTILAFHRIIWDSYQKKYAAQAEKAPLNFLMAPSRLSYFISVFIIWPAVVLIGICLVLIGVFSRL